MNEDILNRSLKLMSRKISDDDDFELVKLEDLLL